MKKSNHFSLFFSVCIHTTDMIGRCSYIWEFALDIRYSFTRFSALNTTSLTTKTFNGNTKAQQHGLIVRSFHFCASFVSPVCNRLKSHNHQNDSTRSTCNTVTIFLRTTLVCGSSIAQGNTTRSFELEYTHILTLIYTYTPT